MPQLCRMREQQIVGLVRTIAARSQAAGATQGGAQRDAASKQIEDLLQTERDLERSWQNLDCAHILYGTR
jgi:hypothetical protein